MDRLPGTAERTGVSAQGYARLRQQPTQLRHRQPAGARRLRQSSNPEGAADVSCQHVWTARLSARSHTVAADPLFCRRARHAVSVTWYVRAHPPADRPTHQGSTGHRPSHSGRPGTEVRLRDRQGQQSPVSPGHDGNTPAERPPRCRGRQSGRMGRGRWHPAGPSEDGDQAGETGDADARSLWQEQ